MLSEKDRYMYIDNNEIRFTIYNIDEVQSITQSSSYSILINWPSKSDDNSIVYYNSNCIKQASMTMFLIGLSIEAAELESVQRQATFPETFWLFQVPLLFRVGGTNARNSARNLIHIPGCEGSLTKWIFLAFNNDTYVSWLKAVWICDLCLVEITRYS